MNFQGAESTKDCFMAKEYGFQDCHAPAFGSGLADSSLTLEPGIRKTDRNKRAFFG